jgi:hypothetical protein
LLLLPGCGSDDKGEPIPAGQADRLISAIQAADQYNADGRCTRAHTKIRDARFLLTRVPDSVDPDVRLGIGDGLERLNSLIEDECERPQSTETDTTPTTTTVTETQTTPTETQQTETTPTQTQPTDTTTVPTSTTPTQTETTTTTGGNGGTPPGNG